MLGSRILIITLVSFLVVGCANNQEPSTETLLTPSTQVTNSASQSEQTPDVTEVVQTTPTPEPNLSVPELVVDRDRLSSELHLYNWDDWIDQSILADFEAEYGVHVVIHTFDSNEDMLQTLSEGNPGYDVAVPQDYAVEIMIREDMVMALDKTLIPNIAYLNSNNLNLYYDPDNMYSVPYLLGMTGIVFNKNAFSTPPTSWAALFDVNELENYPQQATMIDSEREVISAALMYLGRSINDADPETLSQVEELLLNQQPFLLDYDVANTLTAERLANEEIVIAHAVSGTAIAAMDAANRTGNSNVEIGFVIPEEGGVVWQDNLVILSDAPNPYTAHVFINYLLRPEMAARNAEAYGYITPNLYAERLLSPDLQALFQEGFAPDSNLYNRLQWTNSANTDAFHDMWQRVRGTPDESDSSETPEASDEPELATAEETQQSTPQPTSEATEEMGATATPDS